VKVLFVIPTAFALEPLGVMLLTAICKRHGHTTSLAILSKSDLVRRVAEFEPDVVAYSATSADAPVFKTADDRLRTAMRQSGRRVFRIMGGPYPTFTPSVIDELELDAICQGEGDHAMPELLRRLEAGESIEGIPNIALTSAGAPLKELVQDLDAQPIPDRDEYYRVVPYYRISGMRSLITGRGCPYNCTYCFNQAFNDMFRGCGPILRRRSVENVLEEIEYMGRHYPPMRLVRFTDDTFAHGVDPWLEEFCEKYPRRIGLPFYCLMRSNTLTEDTARLLKQAGCHAVSMSIESGSEAIRNGILGRSLTDERVRESFAIAKRYGLRTFASTMLAIPGTSLKEDFESLEFVRRLKPTAPLFPIWTPYRGTQMWQQAVDAGLLDTGADVANWFNGASALNCYTPEEKNTQLRICFVGPLYVNAPRFLQPLLLRLIKSRIPIGLMLPPLAIYVTYRISTRIFPQGIPRSPSGLFHMIVETVKYMATRGEAQKP